MGSARNDPTYKLTRMHVLRGHLIKEIRDLLWSSIQKQEEEVAFQEEEVNRRYLIVHPR